MNDMPNEVFIKGSAVTGKMYAHLNSTHDRDQYYHKRIFQKLTRKLDIALKTLEELKELAFEDSEWHGIINKTLKEMENDNM